MTLLALILLLTAEAPASAVVPPTCAKPALPDRALQPAELNGLMHAAQAYIDCMEKTIAVERADADTLLEKARAQAEKSNAMVAEVNAFIKAVQAYQAETVSGQRP